MPLRKEARVTKTKTEPVNKMAAMKLATLTFAKNKVMQQYTKHIKL